MWHMTIWAMFIWGFLSGMNGFFITNKQAHHVMTMSFMVGSNKKQKTSLIRYIIFYVDACNFMEHAHLSHGHIIFKVLVTHWVKV